MRTFACAVAAAAIVLAGIAARAENAPGVTATEIKIGQTMAYSGPASIYGAIGRAEAGYFKMIDDQGGINGRKIVFLSRDDGYSPPKAVEQTRKLVEEDQVALMFDTLGTPTSAAVRPYLNAKKVPPLLISSGADQFLDPQHFPWTLPYNPSYRVEGQIYGKYILSALPNAKIGILYQHDDLGRDYIKGVKEALGDRYAKMVVREESYEIADPTVDSQIVSLKQSGADTVLLFSIAKPTAQALRKMHDLGWTPTRFINLNSAFVVTLPGMAALAAGTIGAAPYKDITDPALAKDPSVVRFFHFADKYLDAKAKADPLAFYGYGVAETMAQILKQCGADLSRDNIMRQATNLRGFHGDNLLDGITLNSSATDYRLIRQMQMGRFNGKVGEPIGGLIAVQ